MRILLTGASGFLGSHIAEQLDEQGAEAPADLRRAVEMTGGRAALEASGRVTADTVRPVAETGVDYISSGWITHSAPSLDFGLDFVSKA